jgi:hypothetical protein
MGQDTAKKRIDWYRKRVEELGFYDCNVWLGRPDGFPLARPAHAVTVEKMMRTRRLRGVLVSHWEAVSLSAQHGNESLLGAVTSLPEGCPVIYTGLPLFPADEGPLPGPGTPLLNLAGIRLFPGSHGFNLQNWVVGPLLDWLESRRLPLFVWHTEVDWAELYALASSRPHLPFIVETQREKVVYHTRVLFSLMHACENVYVESSNLVGSGYVEYVVREFGARRILFGSFFPVNDPAVAMGMIIDADINEKDRRLIASENILRLVGEVAH